MKTFKVIPKSVTTESPDMYTLSQEQKDFYWKNGYLVIKGLIDYTILYSCKQRFIQICKGLVDKGNITVMKEISLINSGATGEDLINKIQDILYDDVMSTYVECPRLLRVVTQLVGSDNVTAVHSMFINKPPGSLPHPPHQDLHYFPFRPADRVTAAWTAVDHVTRDNGALYVLPRSHALADLRPHGYCGTDGANNAMYHGLAQSPSLEDALHLEMSPGDTVFFHPLLVHGSGPNLTKGYRKSISCHYAASECEYIDVAGTTQENIAREVEGIAKKRGLDLTFNDIWKYRSKQVKGVKCNL